MTLRDDIQNRTDLEFLPQERALDIAVLSSESAKAPERARYMYEAIRNFEKTEDSYRIKINRVKNLGNAIEADVTGYFQGRKININNPVLIVNPRIMVGTGRFVTLQDDAGNDYQKEIMTEDPEGAFYQQIKDLIDQVK